MERNREGERRETLIGRKMEEGKGEKRREEKKGKKEKK